jgi:hypothetical protein
VKSISESLDFGLRIAPPQDNQQWGEFKVRTDPNVFVVLVTQNHG